MEGKENILDILQYMEEIFGEVPTWDVDITNYQPTIEYLTTFQHEVITAGEISNKDKELMLVGVNAARRYEKGMLYHTKNALDAGASLQELIEILTPCILSRGIPAWFEGVKAIQFAKKYNGNTSSEKAPEENMPEADFQDVDDARCYFTEEAGGVTSDWVKIMEEVAPEVLLHYANLRASTLKDGIVPRKLKEFVLVAINVAERYETGIKLHAKSARELGATDKELAEVMLLGFLASGLPAWFEGSEFIQET